MLSIMSLSFTYVLISSRISFFFKAHKRRKAPLLLGRARGRGVDCHRNLLHCAHADSQRTGHLWPRLWVARGHLLWLQETRCFLCGPQVARHLLCRLMAVGGLSTTQSFLCDIQEVGTNHSSHLRNQREAWTATTRGL